MNIDTQIRAWKDPKFRATLKDEGLLPNPAGDRLIELDEDEIRSVWGGGPSSGYVCSLSGECDWPDGDSCWIANQAP